jgi:hypothetical protein
MNVISNHLDEILQHYTKDSYYEEMKKAIEIYTDKTGKMDEESEEYESRMNSFNDWFIFNYRKSDGTKIIDNYISDHNIGDDAAKSFHNANYSIFLFQKINFRKQIVIKDILHNEKFVLAKDNKHLALVEDDLFIGRVVEINGDHYLLNGLCSLPRDVYSILKKESKKVRKLNNDLEEEAFLLKLENLKTKSLQYGHLESSKIFKF